MLVDAGGGDDVVVTGAVRLDGGSVADVLVAAALAGHSTVIDLGALDGITLRGVKMRGLSAADFACAAA
ncbi:hypothetical protein [Thetidibacter halocola]|uniref:Uncharacterized protein n=1 Tax=Thetidibacter halocola TaxID=2827239 RepID=A0A8J7WD47_9RHOB|nr:hypothetical protein [Thetidibacter halocola]MBS0123176.1 hypothetical protein [Thetidibacter halocola]